MFRFPAIRPRLGLLAATAAIALGCAGASPAAAQMRIGDNNNITTEATARNVTAAAIGNRTRATATVAGLTSGGGVEIGNRNTINLRGNARNVTAMALGNRSAAHANVGGVSGN
jgi:hypothetical protein